MVKKERKYVYTCMLIDKHGMNRFEGVSTDQMNIEYVYGYLADKYGIPTEQICLLNFYDKSKEPTTNQKTDKMNITPDPQRPKTFRSICNLMADTYDRKNEDYGNSFDSTLDKYGIVAAIVRMNDKLSRIDTITKNGTTKVSDEKIEDTLIDLACYSVMTLQWLRSQKNDTQCPGSKK